MLRKFWPFHVIGAPEMNPWSLPNAMMLPVNVEEAEEGLEAERADLEVGRAPSASRRYSATPTSAVARPPKECESAIRSGIFVIGIAALIATPIALPTTHAREDPLVGDDVLVKKRPDDGDEHADFAEEEPAPRPLGRRQAAEAEDEEDRRYEVAEAQHRHGRGHDALPCSSLRSGGRRVFPLEHPQHAVGDHEAADDVDRRAAHRDEAEDLADRDGPTRRRRATPTSEMPLMAFVPLMSGV